MQIRIHDRRQLVYSADLDGVLHLGRQRDVAEKPYSHAKDGDHWRVVIARVDESFVSRDHVRVEPLSDGGVRLTNLSDKSAVRLEAGPELKPKGSHEAPLPLALVFGTKSVRLQQPREDEVVMQTLAEATLAPASDIDVAGVLSGLKPPPGGGADAEAFVRWMRVTMDVLQSAAGAQDFFTRAARAVVDLVGFDAGRVLLLQDGVWQSQVIQARTPDAAATDRPASRQVLSKVRQEKRTFWQVPSVAGESLAGINAVVAAPILNRYGEVIGALYGDRGHAAGALAPITKLEAMLVELLAGGVATGLARVEQEQAALRARVQFEQFFTPELARELTAHPELLNGKELEVTVLVCDIRGFSRVTERLGPARTMEWINDVLGELSNCVLKHGGVLVDYVGDELEAMFGAPVGHANHAQRACQAALAMLDSLPQLQERWLHATGEPMAIGIGINSGAARVGNIGSAQKFKYGPLGNTVNLASRVQGASKYLKATLLVTEATRNHLDEGFATRKLCQVRVINIENPVALYELVGAVSPNWAELKDTYEQALACFEKKEFLQTAHLLGKLLPKHPSDGPTQALLSRAVTCLLEEPKDFDAVWKLPGK